MIGPVKSRLYFAFTLVELLIVIAIIGILVALLLPAVQSAREAARRAHCTNNLKQLSLGALEHESTVRHYPYGGWGFRWIGVEGRGYKQGQPGGWAYNILPFIEQKDIHDLGSTTNLVPENEDYSLRLRTPVCAFLCPSRRGCQTWAVDESRDYLSRPYPAGSSNDMARSDYSINGGSLVSAWPGPESISEGDDPNYYWQTSNDIDGVSYLRLGVKSRQITDGLTNTYLIGEKFLAPDHYHDGMSPGDNETLYSGFCSDLYRFTRIDLVPHPDTNAKLNGKGFLRFGSAHPSAWHMSMCDGSVQAISYDISAEVHRSRGSIDDNGLFTK